MSVLKKIVIYIGFGVLGLMLPVFLFSIFTFLNSNGWAWELARNFGDFALLIHDNLVITLYYLINSILIIKLYSLFSKSVIRTISVLLLATPSALLSIFVLKAQLERGIGSHFSYIVELSGVISNILVLLWVPVLYFYLGKIKSEK